MKARRIHGDGGQVVATSKVLLQTRCGKRGYTSRKIAAAMAARARNESGEPIEAYRCIRGCHCFHIGHPPGWHAEQAKSAAS